MGVKLVIETLLGIIERTVDANPKTGWAAKLMKLQKVNGMIHFSYYTKS